MLHDKTSPGVQPDKSHDKTGDRGAAPSRRCRGAAPAGDAEVRPQQAMQRCSLPSNPKQLMYRTGGAPHKPDRTQRACLTAAHHTASAGCLRHAAQSSAEQSRAHQGVAPCCGLQSKDTAGLQQKGHRQLAALTGGSSSITRPPRVPGSPPAAAARQTEGPQLLVMSGRADETSRCSHPSTAVQPQTSRTATDQQDSSRRGAVLLVLTVTRPHLARAGNRNSSSSRCSAAQQALDVQDRQVAHPRPGRGWSRGSPPAGWPGSTSWQLRIKL